MKPRTEPRSLPLLAALLCALALSGPLRAQEAPRPDFQSWLEGVRAEALARGISRPTLEAALAGIQPIERVIELDRQQPEFVDTFWNYLDRRVTPQRVGRGAALLEEHQALLGQLERRHGVPARLLVAFWGLETNYGRTLGSHPVPAALATLAYDGRRSAFFRRELLEALAILEAGHVAPQAMVGSWAGAMGQMQFMPSTFRAYAIDADGDGKKDLWGTLPDAFASAANYLAQAGWQPGETWGREVRLPADFSWQLAHLGVKKPIAAWAAMGVTRADGSPLPSADMAGAILLPQGHAGPAFMVYRNFEIILAWNRSVSYALAVGHLADRIAGLPPLANGREADNRRLSREQILELQQRLVALGFDLGEADGVLGSRTKAAIRTYQKSAGLPADGYPSVTLLEQLQSENSSSPGQGETALRNVLADPARDG